jgi:hypothetical protein
MMKYWRKKTTFLLLAAAFLLYPLSAQAEEEKNFFIRFWERIKSRIIRKEAVKTEKEAPKKDLPEKEKKPQKVKREKPSKTEMIDTMKRRLRVFPNIVGMIPGLSRKEQDTGEGVVYYYQTSDGVAVELEKLDDKTLYRIYVRVNQEATRMHTERLLRQIRQQEQLQRLQDLQRMQTQPARTPSVPQQPPKVYTPPKGPPAPPPSPPERR